jgi:type III restriction enzyme
VDRNGERIFDDNINRLTVIASESFEEYAEGLQKDIEQDVGGGFKFGRIEQIGFSSIINPESKKAIGQEQSQVLWKTLVDLDYLSKLGDITDKFAPEKAGFKLELPENIELFAPSLIDELRRYVFRNRIVNTRDRKILKYNKQIALNEDFKILWDKINKKTKYSVEFKTESLIQKATDKIKKMPPINPIKIMINKTELELDEAGVEGGRVLESRTVSVAGSSYLPDILAYLQRETELTRGTLVEILKQSGRLKEFFINPQSFMTEVSKLLNRSLHELVIDGIKYEKVDGSMYEMRFFEQREIEEYLSRLYEVQSQDDRTLYDYIPFDSEIEREIAEKLDTDESVKFFCKLPRWFQIPTPLGNYNPDWAVVTENGTKLYLVRETKSTHDRDARREIENQKIDCGAAHFKALGVNFKVATNIHEALQE